MTDYTYENVIFPFSFFPFYIRYTKINSPTPVWDSLAYTNFLFHIVISTLYLKHDVPLFKSWTIYLVLFYVLSKDLASLFWPFPINLHNSKHSYSFFYCNTSQKEICFSHFFMSLQNSFGARFWHALNFLFLRLFQSSYLSFNSAIAVCHHLQFHPILCRMNFHYEIYLN